MKLREMHICKMFFSHTQDLEVKNIVRRKRIGGEGRVRREAKPLLRMRSSCCSCFSGCNIVVPRKNKKYNTIGLFFRENKECSLFKTIANSNF